MPSRNQPAIQTSSPLSALTSPRKHLTCGQRRSSPGSVTGISPTPTSTRLLVRLIVNILWALLILVLSGPSESEIRRRLTLEEERDAAAASTTIDSVDDFTQTKYLLYGLDLEEQQYVSLVLELDS